MSPWQRPFATRTGATGVASCAPSSRWKPTTVSSGWARWAAAAKARRRPSRRSSPTSSDTIRQSSSSFASRSRTPRRRSTTIGRRWSRRSSSRASTFSARAWGVPVSEILGGRLRDHVPFASYLFFRYPSSADGSGEVRTCEQLVAEAKALKAKHGFTTHKLKGGVFRPEYELECYRALAHELAGDRFRFDPNGVWSTEQAIWFGRHIEDLNNDYLEDPVFGLHGMRRAREKLRLPLATNTVVVNFEQLAANVLQTAVDVILLDTTFWGGIRSCVKAAAVCDTFQLGVAVHSSGELGIQLATMLHLGAVIPNITFAADAHYHHLADDVIQGGKMSYCRGSIPVPKGAGPRREARSRSTRRVSRGFLSARQLSVRSGSAAPGLGAAGAEHGLGRPSRRAGPPDSVLSRAPSVRRTLVSRGVAIWRAVASLALVASSAARATRHPAIRRRVRPVAPLPPRRRRSASRRVSRCHQRDSHRRRLADAPCGARRADAGPRPVFSGARFPFRGERPPTVSSSAVRRAAQPS